MIVKSPQDLKKLKAIGQIVANCLDHMKSSARPGMSTLELDEIGRTFLEDQGARSAPELCYKFPGATCISLKNEVAHGVPSAAKFLQAGDLINVDVSAEKDGLFADTGASFVLGEAPENLIKLCQATKQALYAALSVVRAGEKISVIGRAIETTAQRLGYTVIENLGSHGVGRKLHEEPKFIAGFFDSYDKRVLKENQVITIEPFISTGATRVDEDHDGWTLKTASHIRSTQYEHTLVVTKGKPLILTLSEATRLE